MMEQLEEGKRPFFGRSEKKSGGNVSPSVNMQTVEMMKQLGAEVKGL